MRAGKALPARSRPTFACRGERSPFWVPGHRLRPAQAAGALSTQRDTGRVAGRVAERAMEQRLALTPAARRVHLLYRHALFQPIAQARRGPEPTRPGPRVGVSLGQCLLLASFPCFTGTARIVPWKDSRNYWKQLTLSQAKQRRALESILCPPGWGTPKFRSPEWENKTGSDD